MLAMANLPSKLHFAVVTKRCHILLLSQKSGLRAAQARPFSFSNAVLISIESGFCKSQSGFSKGKSECRVRVFYGSESGPGFVVCFFGLATGKNINRI